MVSEAAPRQQARLDAANPHGREPAEGATRATTARYDRTTRRVTIDLANGCTYAFPTRLVPDLDGATDEQLEDVGLDGLGLHLRWVALGADFHVAALVSEVFGTRGWTMSEFARRAGQATSPAKAAAARANGAKGGRPRKAAGA